KGEPGLNRIWWDLSYDAPTPVHLLTPPLDAPWVRASDQLGFGHSNAAAEKEGWRPLAIWGTDEGPGLRAAPGRYTAKLTVGEQSLTEPLEILRDPNSQGSQTDLQAQVKFLLQLRSELSDLGEMINHLERTRLQVENLHRSLSGPKAADAAKA